MSINKKLRGIRDSIPGGYFLGRTGAGNGPPILLPMSQYMTTPGYVANTTIQIGGAAGGDLSGTYPNPTVAKIQTIPVKAGTPSDGNLLTYVAANSDWEPVAPASLSASVPGVDKIIDRAVLDLLHDGIATGGGGGGGQPSARYWRIRLVNTLFSHNQTDGAGFCLVEWRNSGGTNLVGSGTPFASHTDTGGGWTLVAAFDGTSGSGHGWFSGANSALSSWLAYDFGSAVTPTKVLYAPLTGFDWSVQDTIAVEYSANSSVWQIACTLTSGAGVDHTQQTFTIPTAP